MNDCVADDHRACRHAMQQRPLLHEADEKDHNLRQEHLGRKGFIRLETPRMADLRPISGRRDYSITRQI